MMHVTQRMHLYVEFMYAPLAKVYSLQIKMRFEGTVTTALPFILERAEAGLDWLRQQP